MAAERHFALPGATSLAMVHVLALLLLLAAADAADALAIWSTSSGFEALLLRDTESPAATLIGPFHPDENRYTTPIHMAVRPSDGAIFIQNNTPFRDAGISRVNRNTGRAVPVLIGSPPDNVHGSIAFGPDDTFYQQLMNTTGVNATAPIGTVDLDAGSRTSLGGPDLPRLFALDYSPTDGLLYAAPAGEARLLKIDPSSGQLVGELATFSAGDDPAICAVSIGSLLFTPEGELLMSDGCSRLWDVDLETGLATRPRLFQWAQGMGLVRGVEPPGLLLLAGACLAGRRRPAGRAPDIPRCESHHGSRS